jgi:uncharacterized OsmC-like protein
LFDELTSPNQETTMTAKNTASMPPINGVDRDALFATIDAVKADPAIAKFQFRLRNRWIDGGENRSSISDFFAAKEEMRHVQTFELVNDEPPVLLGNDIAPNPVEFVLHALAGCLTTSMIVHAAARGIEIKGVRTRFEADNDMRGFLGLDPNVRRGFQNIRVTFDIDADMDEAGKRDLIAMAQKYSPVFDIVSNGVPVTCTLGKSESVSKAA